MIKIDKNIPIGAANKYPFIDMVDIGDSFLYKLKKGELRATVQARIIGACQSFNRTQRTKIKITTRRVEKGIRVWRIK